MVPTIEWRNANGLFLNISANMPETPEKFQNQIFNLSIFLTNNHEMQGVPSRKGAKSEDVDVARHHVLNLSSPMLDRPIACAAPKWRGPSSRVGLMMASKVSRVMLQIREIVPDAVK
jgi:hypothetical protein